MVTFKYQKLGLYDLIGYYINYYANLTTEAFLSFVDTLKTFRIFPNSMLARFKFPIFVKVQFYSDVLPDYTDFPQCKYSHNFFS